MALKWQTDAPLGALMAICGLDFGDAWHANYSCGILASFTTTAHFSISALI
jgi:hypothetical protein